MMMGGGQTTSTNLDVLSQRQTLGLCRLGAAILGKLSTMPSFADTVRPDRVDTLLAYLPPADRAGVRLLLGILGWLPTWAAAGLIAVLGVERALPDAWGAGLRKVSFGLRGLVLTLYYADPSVLKICQYETHVDPVADPNEGLYARVHQRAAALEKGESLMSITDLEVTQSFTASTLDRPASDGPVSANLGAAGDAVSVMHRARQAERHVSALSLTDRIAMLTRLRRVILGDMDAILDELQRETGKTRTDALVGDIFGILDHLYHLEARAESWLKVRKKHTPLALLGKASWLVREPIGTVLVIAPWNYPLYLVLVPAMSAFVAGNAVVVKPSECTPLVGLVERLLRAAGFAGEWVQLVYGDGAVGAELIRARPDKVFFTGSVATGRKILSAAAAQLTPVELELGGKDAMLVFGDADIARATSGALWGAMTNAGQSCTAVERCYVHQSILEDFCRELSAKARRLTIGTDKDGDRDIGRITTAAQLATIADHVADAKARGARVLVGAEWDGKSNPVPPIVLSGVDESMRIMHEETFGPVIPIVPFSTEEQAVALANRSDYGLSASVWTGDKARAWRVAKALRVGNVSVNNVMLTEGNPDLPFGGRGNSGFGRIKGEDGLLGFTCAKSIMIDANSRKIEANWYPYTPGKYRLLVALVRALFSDKPLRLIRVAAVGLRLESLAKKLP